MTDRCLMKYLGEVDRCREKKCDHVNYRLRLVNGSGDGNLRSKSPLSVITMYDGKE